MRGEFIAPLDQRLERFLLIARRDLICLPGIVKLQKTGSRRELPAQAYANVDTPRLGLKYEVLYSSDLHDWQVLETITLETSPQVYVDKTATEQPMRFYQLRLID